MAAKLNGMWDFKNYDEKTWFKFLVLKLIMSIIVYIFLHVYLVNSQYGYEYTKLNQDQMQFINKMYIDKLSASSTGNQTQTDHSNITTLGQTQVSVNPKAPTSSPVTIATPVNPGLQTRTAQKQPTPTPTAPVNQVNHNVAVKDTALSEKTMNYLNNVFENGWETDQKAQILKFLSQATSQEVPGFLNGTRFKVHSYFWLVGPCVYWEVIFWSIFGVLASLLFSLGVVGSNFTTNLTNPKSQFDSSEIFGQVAKILYAPLCTLIVILGYNYFNDHNIVDISSSKGVIVFAFFGGFYSSRLISLMDRLKDILLPASGSSSLPTLGTPTPTPGVAITMVTVQVSFGPTVNPATITAAGPAGINNSAVAMKSMATGISVNGIRNPADPLGVFSLANIMPGSYIITASLSVPVPGIPPVNLTAQINGQVMSAGAPIVLTY